MRRRSIGALLICHTLIGHRSQLWIVWSSQRSSGDTEKQEYKITVSELLTVTTNEHYLLDPTDTDSHCPLLVRVELTTSSEQEKNEYKTIEGTYKRAQTRKERQKANKAKGKAQPTAVLAVTHGTLTYQRDIPSDLKPLARCGKTLLSEEYLTPSQTCASLSLGALHRHVRLSPEGRCTECPACPAE